MTSNKKKGIDMKKISSIISLLFLILFLLVSCEKSSSDWVKYWNNTDGNVFSYKKVNIKNNYMVQVWVKRIFSDKYLDKQIQELTQKGLSTEGIPSEQKDLIETDCKKQSYRRLSTITYDKDGKVLSSEDYDNSKWIHIVPDSENDILLKEVCKQPLTK